MSGHDLSVVYILKFQSKTIVINFVHLSLKYGSPFHLTCMLRCDLLMCRFLSKLTKKQKSYHVNNVVRKYYVALSWLFPSLILWSHGENHLEKM